jgi:hypothetical protein
MFGYTDYSILNFECHRGDDEDNIMLHIRYFVLTPVFVLLVLCLKLVEWKRIEGNLLTNIWNYPYFIGAFYGFYSLSRLFFYFKNSEPCFQMNWRLSNILYSEIYDVCIYLVSSVTVAPVFILGLFGLWSALSSGFIFSYERQMG